MKALVILKFNCNDPDLIHQFPVDKDSDITLLITGKETFQLRMELLRRSKYFDTQLHNSDSKFILIPNKYDSVVFHKILHCFYGYQYSIYKDSELYSAYLVSHFLQINKFIEAIQDSIQENIDKLNFFYVFQLAELTEAEFIREKYMEYLERSPKVWKILLPITKLENFRLNVIDNSTLNSIQSIPDNILLLDEKILIKFIQLHNEFKNKSSFQEYFLIPDDIFKIIQYYVRVRYLNQEERQINTLALVKELFHLEDIILDEKSKKVYQFWTKWIKSDINNPDNKFIKIIEQQNKEVEELKYQLQSYKQKEEDKEIKLKQMQERIEVLMKLLENQKIKQSSENNSGEIETSEYINQNQSIVEQSFLNFNNDESFQRQCQSFLFDSTPQTVFQLSELSYLLQVININIYQQAKFRLLYRGTDNFFHLSSEEQINQIKTATSILILIRTVENESVFGIFNESNKILIIDFKKQKRLPYTKQLKLSINQTYLLKLGNDIEIFVDCCNRNDNICNSIGNLGCLAGKNNFQVDEFEIYECKISNEIV